MPSDSSPEVLGGGNLSHVVRIGDTVRLPSGPCTPTIHALLHHLESAGFDGAPRVQGIDEDDREVLEFLPGAMAWPDMGALATDDGLARAGDLLRRYHEAVAGFVPPPDATWQLDDMRADGERYLGGERPIVCHNDCAAWNLVMGRRWAFIDWDVAGPRPRLWDVAYAIRGMVLVDPDCDVRHRVDVLVSAYGLDVAERRRLPEIVIARIQSSIDGMRRRAEAGVEPWARLWASGHGAAWNETLALATRVFA
jgi:hypothetical protein